MSFFHETATQRPESITPECRDGYATILGFKVVVAEEGSELCGGLLQKYEN